MAEQMTEQDKKEYEQWLDNKNKSKEDKLLDNAMLDIFDELNDQWIKHCRSYNFKTLKEYEAYGNTYVSDGSYITDESDQKCREDFEKDMTTDEFIDCLRLNPSFRNSIAKLIEWWAYNKELEV